MNKPRLSGAQRRRIAAQQAAELGVVVPKLPTLRALEDVRSYRHEINVVYRAMRDGKVPSEFATRATYVLNVAAALARAEQELVELGRLRAKLEQLEGSALPALTNDDADTSVVANGHDTDAPP